MEDISGDTIKGSANNRQQKSADEILYDTIIKLYDNYYSVTNISTLVPQNTSEFAKVASIYSMSKIKLESPLVVVAILIHEMKLDFSELTNLVTISSNFLFKKPTVDKKKITETCFIIYRYAKLINLIIQSPNY